MHGRGRCRELYGCGSSCRMHGRSVAIVTDMEAYLSVLISRLDQASP